MKLTDLFKVESSENPSKTMRTDNDKTKLILFASAIPDYPSDELLDVSDDHTQAHYNAFTASRVNYLDYTNRLPQVKPEDVTLDHARYRKQILVNIMNKKLEFTMTSIAYYSNAFVVNTLIAKLKLGPNEINSITALFKTYYPFDHKILNMLSFDSWQKLPEGIVYEVLNALCVEYFNELFKLLSNRIFVGIDFLINEIVSPATNLFETNLYSLFPAVALDYSIAMNAITFDGKFDYDSIIINKARYSGETNAW